MVRMAMSANLSKVGRLYIMEIRTKPYEVCHIFRFKPLPGKSSQENIFVPGWEGVDQYYQILPDLTMMYSGLKSLVWERWTEHGAVILIPISKPNPVLVFAHHKGGCTIGPHGIIFFYNGVSWLEHNHPVHSQPIFLKQDRNSLALFPDFCYGGVQRYWTLFHRIS